LVIINPCPCGFVSDFKRFLYPFCRAVVSMLTPH
jgi:hypothetical protein